MVAQPDTGREGGLLDERWRITARCRGVPQVRLVNIRTPSAQRRPQPQRRSCALLMVSVAHIKQEAAVADRVSTCLQSSKEIGRRHLSFSSSFCVILNRSDRNNCKLVFRLSSLAAVVRIIRFDHGLSVL